MLILVNSIPANNFRLFLVDVIIKAEFITRHKNTGSDSKRIASAPGICPKVSEASIRYVNENSVTDPMNWY